MLNEDDVPIKSRRLVVEGVLSPNTLERVRAGLPPVLAQTARCLLLSYSYADLPLGKSFQFVVPSREPKEFERTLAVIRAVTQQFGEPFDNIPHGWKTICVVDFPQGVPRLIDRLPAVDAWGESQESVALCCRDTLDALLSDTAFVGLVPALVVEERVPLHLVSGEYLFKSPRVRREVVVCDATERPKKNGEQSAYLRVGWVTT